jgi:hypothetical protein
LNFGRDPVDLPAALFGHAETAQLRLSSLAEAPGDGDIGAGRVLEPDEGILVRLHGSPG